MRNPVAVITSDVHYSLKTLALADAAMRLAIAMANDLDVPLIVAGDLHDTKANMRAEVVSAMIKTFALTHNETYILRGNHDQVNEKSQEHALDFLRCVDEMIYVVDEPFRSVFCDCRLDIYFVPYHHDRSEITRYLKTIPPRSTLIMHQGIKNADAGDYIQDHSAITVDDVAGHRVISGHYHNRQTIELPDGGVWDYVGNPYTLTFGEAGDPEKGFRVLYSDGSLDFVPTNLRKHIVLTVGWNNEEDPHQLFWPPIFTIPPEDLVWLKVKGNRTQLQKVTKDWLKTQFDIPSDFRLELIADDVELSAKESATESMADIPKDRVIDGIIDSATNVTDDQKIRVKALWKDLATKDVK